MPLKIGRFTVKQTTIAGTASRTAGVKADSTRVWIRIVGPASQSLQVFLASGGCSSSIYFSSAAENSIEFTYKDVGDLVTFAFDVSAPIGQNVVITEVLLNPAEF